MKLFQSIVADRGVVIGAGVGSHRSRRGVIGAGVGSGLLILIQAGSKAGENPRHRRRPMRGILPPDALSEVICPNYRKVIALTMYDHRYRVEIAVCGDNVGLAIAIDVKDSHRSWIIASYKSLR
jgi:hypothetical protein